MIRLKLAVIVIGGVMAFFGFQEYRVSSGAGDRPLDVELEEISAGSDMDNPYIKIGKHVCVNEEAVSQYEQDASGNSNASSKVDFTYIPLIPVDHPLYVAVKKFESGPPGITEKDIPALDSYSVLLHTTRYKTLGDLDNVTDSLSEHASVEGMVTNKIKSLTSEEKKYLGESFPGLDLDKLIILEEGRTPTSAGGSLGLMAGGALLIVGGLFSMVASSKR